MGGIGASFPDSSLLKMQPTHLSYHHETAHCTVIQDMHSFLEVKPWTSRFVLIGTVPEVKAHQIVQAAAGQVGVNQRDAHLHGATK